MIRYEIRHVIIQLLRRSVQLSVVLLLFALVFLSLYSHYRAARAVDDVEGLRGGIISRIHKHVDEFDAAEAFLDDNKGTIWSMRLAGVELTDPLAAVETVAASQTVYWPLIVSILIPVIVAVLLGKVFCSWICPAYLLFEITGKLRKLMRLAELSPRQVRFSYANKYILLLVGLLAAAFTEMPLFALIYPPAVVGRIIHAWVFGTALTGMLVLIGVIVVFEVFVSPRWWCRTMCPGGALYGLLGWPRLLRVKLSDDRCTHCAKCEPVCEPGLDPVRQCDGIECDNCGQCVRHCPERALRFTLALPKLRRMVSKRSAAVVAIFLTAAIPLPAQAHHILGLPHYSYKENYPQAPTLEYPASTGPYDVLLTSYPGKPVPGNSANLAFYIKNRNTGVPYDKPITVRILQTFTFGDSREILPPTVVQPFEQPHKLSATFPTDGEYIIELTMDVEGRTEVIPFMMIAGEPSAKGSFLIAVGLALAVFIVVVRAIKIKRTRRAQASPEGPA